ncbi:MAG: ABC transporter ATP-binding protein [Verrucomicrobiota bacterium]
MNAPIQTSSLTKRYGKTVAVNKLSFDAPEGQVTAFLGSNGAGKTTTIQTLLNLQRPSGGSARILGVDSRKLGPEQLRQIGYVSENMELPLWMTVKRFIDYCRPFYPTWDDEFCQQLLEEFQLPMDRKLRNLSRGMRMKAALIGGIAYRPKLVILDEPFSGLDPLVRDEFIRGLLRMTGEEGWTVFLSSHDIEEVERLADRVILIDAGKKRIDESIENLLNKCRRVDVVCSEDPADFEAPGDWLGFRQIGRTLSFGLASANGDIAHEVKAIVPNAERIESRGMSLREAFVMMAEQFRLEN